MALLGTAILAERSALQERRTHAEQAFRMARQCALACLKSASFLRTSERQKCSVTAIDAAESSWELPEHNGQQMELQAALDELIRALAAEDERRLSSAIDRLSRAGGALGWRIAGATLR